MAHPYENYRNDKVERSRVGKMFGPECRIERACGGETMKHRGRGGAMRYAEEDPGGDPQATQPKEFLSKLARKAKAVKDGGMAGKRPKHRMDRKHRARGGRAHHADEAEDRALVREMVKPEARKERARGGRNRKGGKTVVNIHVAPPHGGGDLGRAGSWRQSRRQAADGLAAASYACGWSTAWRWRPSADAPSRRYGRRSADGWGRSDASAWRSSSAAGHDAAAGEGRPCGCGVWG